MATDPIAAKANKLAVLCVQHSMPPIVPQLVLDAHRIAPWFSLSLATVYLALAKHQLAFMHDLNVAMAVGRQMDDVFFDCVKETSFDVKISDVIVQPAERAALCIRSRIPIDEFLDTYSTSESILSFVFADRCNQYTEDLRAGILREAEGKRNVLGPVIFVYKRFNQHMYALECDCRTIDLDESFQFLCPLDSMFMNALLAVTECVSQQSTGLPLVL
jgi:hypothetical protein